ncbi:MAG: four helix bundle protein [Patescibacteria group bacterium]|nr:four helix bundle protein [Patescibacteria group bacterium]
MDDIKNFYDLNAWKSGHKLALEIYKITKIFPKDEVCAITSQLRRASSSVTANIAEGFARYHFKDKIRFYYNARGSATEVQSFLLLAKDLEYINFETCKRLGENANDVGKLINGLIRSIENQNK